MKSEETLLEYGMSSCSASKLFSEKFQFFRVTKCLLVSAIDPFSTQNPSLSVESTSIVNLHQKLVDFGRILSDRPEITIVSTDIQSTTPSNV